eukprot:13582171-Ditylum_brightwellii.AAC.1
MTHCSSCKNAPQKINQSRHGHGGLYHSRWLQGIGRKAQYVYAPKHCNEMLHWKVQSQKKYWEKKRVCLHM